MNSKKIKNSIDIFKGYFLNSNIQHKMTPGKESTSALKKTYANTNFYFT
jgi:hypothetical protein